MTRANSVVRTSALVIVLALVVTACSSSGGDSSSPEASPRGDRVLRTAFTEDVGNIDPDNHFEVAGLGMILAMYQGLVQYKPDSSEVEGVLAESWEVSDDFTQYTFKLRDGVVFHDGTPMTSESVAASFQRRIDHQEFFTGYFLANVKSMKTPDEKTLVVNLASPDYAFLDALASPWGPKVIGPKALVDEAGDDASQTFLSRNGDGTGPYRLAQFERGNEYVLERNNDYWGEEPYFDEISIRIISDVGQQILQLRDGQLDFVNNYPYSQLGSLPAGLNVHSWETFGMETAIINSNRIPDPDARKRIATALDPATWVSDAFGEYGSEALSNFSSVMLKPPEPWELPAPENANADVKALSIAWGSVDTPLQSYVSNFLLARLQEAGINATARPLPTGQFDQTAEDPENGPDVSLVHFYPDHAYPGSLTGLVFACGAPLNYLGYCNEEMDALFNKAYATPDEEAANELFLEGAKIGWDDAAFIGLANIDDVIVYREGLTSLVTRPGVPWNFDYGLVREE
jgi:peptide/nickel transport system substrate-binding protein